MYSHLLDLSVDVEQADDGCFGSGCCDILMIEMGCSPDSESGILELSAMDTHVVIVSGDTESASMGSRLCTLPANWTIRDFYELLRTCSPSTVSSVSDSRISRRWYGTNTELQERILEVISIIKREYEEDLSLDYLAGSVYFSPCYLSSLFNKFMGVSAPYYLNSYRMKIAARYLLTTDMTLAEISELVGYRNIPYFCTLFKRIYGMTPTQYRMSAA